MDSCNIELAIRVCSRSLSRQVPLDPLYPPERSEANMVPIANPPIKDFEKRIVMKPCTPSERYESTGLRSEFAPAINIKFGAFLIRD